MVIKNKDELNTLRECGKRLAKILENVVHTARHGVTTEELDRLAESLIFESGGLPSFKNYKPEEREEKYEQWAQENVVCVHPFEYYAFMKGVEK